MSDKEILSSAVKRNEQMVNLIWGICDELRDVFKVHEYGRVILPMTVIKRFHDCLSKTHDHVLLENRELDEKGISVKEVKENILYAASGHPFYNISPYTFTKLLDAPDDIDANFRNFLAGFSANVSDILEKFKFGEILSKLEENKLLYRVVKHFNTAELSTEKFSTIDMGYVLEHLVQRYSESYDEDAGAHFTSRDIVYLMTDLLLAGEKSSASGSRTVYDMAMGTSQMLTCMQERLEKTSPGILVQCYGQEVNDETYAIAKSETLIHNGDSDSMRFGNTLSEDKFADRSFDYIISNPPFGIDWKKSEDAVVAEAKTGKTADGHKGRFSWGLPPKSDGQLLFLMNGVAKLDRTGRMAIIQNGSSLFAGDAGSGPSEIRRHLVEEERLDAIVQLPTDSFYNTGIATYIWIVTGEKPESHKGKVLLIDASQCYEPGRKTLGKCKRNNLTEECRAMIVRLYGDYATAERRETLPSGQEIVCKSRVLANNELGYRKIVVESPERDEQGQVVRKKGKPVADAEKRDFENVPMTEEVDDFFEREVRPNNPDAWIDKTKTKVGYEIPFTRVFYVYRELESAKEIAKRIRAAEKKLLSSLDALLGEEREE